MTGPENLRPARAGAARAPGEVELRTYFPTPVALVELSDAAALNRELTHTILERERATPGTQHSNLGGWQSDWEFAQWGGPAGQRVLETARSLASHLTANRRGQAVTVAWRMNAWANVNRHGHANEFHGHPGSFWSGTYYVDDGGVGDDPSLGGEFEIQDPRGLAPAMYAPLLGYAFPGGQSIGASELIRPRTGTLMLFPAWLYHAVRPYRGTRLRISVAFNLSV